MKVNNKKNKEKKKPYANMTQGYEMMNKENLR
jgi:hypothetical protein